MDSGEISYTFYATDNLTPTIENITRSNEELSKSVEGTASSANSATIAFMGTMIAVMSLYSGFRRLTMSLHQLGVLSDGNYQKMMKLAAAVGLVVSVFQMMKGVIFLVNKLKNAEIGLALVETYRAILHNPAKMGLALAGVAAAGLAIGYLAGGAGGGGGKTEVTQTVSFGGYGPSQGQREAARGTLEFAGG